MTAQSLAGWYDADRARNARHMQAMRDGRLPPYSLADWQPENIDATLARIDSVIGPEPVRNGKR